MALVQCCAMVYWLLLAVLVVQCHCCYGSAALIRTGLTASDRILPRFFKDFAQNVEMSEILEHFSICSESEMNKDSSNPGNVRQSWGFLGRKRSPFGVAFGQNRNKIAHFPRGVHGSQKVAGFF